MTGRDLTIEKEKMKQFVGKLWMNPVVMQTSIGKKENQILLFLRENQQQVQKIFSAPDYFPHLSWDEAIRLLLAELLEKIFDTISPKLDRLKESVFLPELMGKLDSSAAINEESFKSFLLGIMKNKQIRDQMLQIMETISFELFEKYIPEILVRRKTIYTELVRRDRLSLEPHQFPGYINFTMIFRPLYFLKIPYKAGSNEILSIGDMGKDVRKIETMISALRTHISSEIGMVPESVVRPAIESHLSAHEFPDTSGTSRLINIICARSAVYDPAQKTDRGAESPDKSWFNINRRNAKYYGYDSRMLEELYQIAGDKGW